MSVQSAQKAQRWTPRPAVGNPPKTAGQDKGYPLEYFQLRKATVKQYDNTDLQETSGPHWFKDSVENDGINCQGDLNIQ